MKRSISTYTVLRISIAAVFLLVTIFLTGNYVLAVIMGVVGYFALRILSWFNAWGWPFVWILLIPIVTVFWSVDLADRAINESTCTLIDSAEGMELQGLYQIWRCPREDMLPTLLPGLLNLVAFAWVLSTKREVRWAALIAGALGAARLAVPVAIYWHSGAYLEIHGYGLPSSQNASLSLWLLSAVSTIVFLVGANTVESRKRKQAATADQPRAREQCNNCGKRLTVDDKLRSRETGICWDCFVASPDARRIRLLDRLRDDGLITGEEYEKKRAREAAQ